jgi:hypothetical protein
MYVLAFRLPMGKYKFDICTHRAKCYVIVLCAYRIPPLVIKKYQHSAAQPFYSSWCDGESATVSAVSTKFVGPTV